MDLRGKKVLVFGTGISGIGAGALLERAQASVILYDGNENLDKENLRKHFAAESSVEILLGSLPLEVMDQLELVVLSPGVPTDLPLVNQLREREIPIWGEVELAYRFASGEVLAITGTNGKTTTTALLGEIMKAYRDSVFVVGNIGTPYTGASLEMKADSVTVAEMSSFQLETIDTFHPKVSAILNITPDHLNRHHTMEAYIQAKEEITKNQTEEDVCVLNYEDEVLRAFGEKLHTQVLYFSSRRKLERGIYLEDGKIIYADGKPEVLCKVEELKLLGTHNYESVMAASAMAAAYGVPLSSIRETIRNFGGVAHRIEFVTEKEGVAYYNDSKGTNPDAAIKAVEAMNRPTILIGGGYDKNSSYDEWIDSFGEKVRYLVLVGATKEKIAETARRKGFDNVILADTFEEAVMESARLAREGDAVLLSPACASWGMFKNFEERGDKFKELVNHL